MFNVKKNENSVRVEKVKTSKFYTDFLFFALRYKTTLKIEKINKRMVISKFVLLTEQYKWKIKVTAQL